MAKKWYASPHNGESNLEDPFPLAYQKSAQSDNKNLYQKYLIHPEMTEKQQKKKKLYLNDRIWQKSGRNQSHKGLSFSQKVVFL